MIESFIFNFFKSISNMESGNHENEPSVVISDSHINEGLNADDTIQEVSKNQISFPSAKKKQKKLEIKTNSQMHTENKIRKQAIKLRREKERLQTRLQGFDYKKSYVYQQIYQQFGVITFSELTSIATLVSKTIHISLDRDAKRRKIVLYKWFDEHWNQIQPYIQYIRLSDTYSYSDE